MLRHEKLENIYRCVSSSVCTFDGCKVCCRLGLAWLGWELAIFRLLGKNTENIWEMEMEERGYRFIQLLFFISSSWTAENWSWLLVELVLLTAAAVEIYRNLTIIMLHFLAIIFIFNEFPTDTWHLSLKSVTKWRIWNISCLTVWIFL